MRFEVGGKICGVPTAALRHILRRDKFTTPDLMQIIQTPEPKATIVLRALAHDGWIAWSGVHQGVDWWDVTAQGQRLTATLLIKRFPIKEGLAIVDKLVAKARELNSNPDRSRRVVAMHLFGSVLTGSHDGTVGDVDVVVEIKRRHLPEERLAELVERELSHRPDAGFYERLFLPERILRRELRSVSPKLSIHGEEDLQLPGVPFRQVYAFDAVRDREVPFDAAERVGNWEPDEVDASPKEHAEPYPDRPFRPWPAPGSKTARVTIQGDEARLAQHLWQNDLSASEIAPRIYASPKEVRSFLASRGSAQLEQPAFDASLEAMLLSALPADRRYDLVARVGVGPSWRLPVEVEIFAPRSIERLGRVVFSSRSDPFLHEVRPDFAGTLEGAALICHAWRERMKAPVGKLALEAICLIHPDSALAPAGDKAVGFKMLEPPLRVALSEMWTPEDRDSNYVRLDVELSNPNRSRIRFRRGVGSHSSEAMVPKHLTAPVLDLVRPLRRKWAVILNGNTTYTVSFPASRLTNLPIRES